VRIIRVLVAALCLALAGCAGGPSQPVAGGATQAADGASDRLEVARFSRRSPEEPLADHWQPLLIPFKNRTRYAHVRTAAGVGLEAEADRSASGLLRKVSIDPRRHPTLEWRWRVDQAIPEADKTVASREDSPARLLVAFDGDRSRLDIEERSLMNLAEALSGQKMPYATLMYVYSNRHPPGTVLPNPRTRRIQMIVVEQGGEGRWTSFRRNVLEDYRRAFGEEPGRIESVGVMTDADNTQSHARAVYGDISFVAGR
jgi:hypothetical protein